MEHIKISEQFDILTWIPTLYSIKAFSSRNDSHAPLFLFAKKWPPVDLYKLPKNTIMHTAVKHKELLKRVPFGKHLDFFSLLLMHVSKSIKKHQSTTKSNGNKNMERILF